MNFNKNANIFCVYPTAIFLLKKDFTNALKIINKKNKNFIFCATRCSSNLQRSFIVNKNLEISKIMNKKKLIKIQDLLNLYEDLGYFYLAKSNVWLKNNSPITNKSSIIEIPKIRSVDINTYDDLKLAKILYKNKLNENNNKKIDKYLKIIDKIEKTRSGNNINWMNLLRIAIKNSPDETIRVLKKINSGDNKISNLLKKIK